MIRLAVAGAGGKMGRTLLALAKKDSEFKIAAAFEDPQSREQGKDLGLLLGCESLGIKIQKDVSAGLQDADVLIDFTHPSATPVHLQAALKAGKPYVLGTTGLPENVLESLQAASQKIPIVQSPNMSVGVNLLFRLAETAGKVLNENYDIEIVETHHRQKKDAPSGTAVKLVEILSKIRHGKNTKVVHGREGETGARPQGEIGVFAIRGGDVVGDHTVYFLGSGERLELSHRASSREAFAQGALRAAKFVVTKKHGLYNMIQVLGLE